MKLKNKHFLEKYTGCILILPLLLSSGYYGLSTVLSDVNNKNNITVDNSRQNPNYLNAVDYGHTLRFENSNTILSLFMGLEQYFDYKDAAGSGLYWSLQGQHEELASFLNTFPLLTDPATPGAINFTAFKNLMITKTGQNDMTFLESLKAYASDSTKFPELIDTSKFIFDETTGSLEMGPISPLTCFKIITGTFLNWANPNIDAPTSAFGFHGYSLDFLFPDKDSDPQGIINRGPVSCRIGSPLSKVLEDVLDLTMQIPSTLLLNVFSFDSSKITTDYKITGENDYISTVMYKFFASIERVFEAYHPEDINMREFNEGVMKRYLNYDAWYGDEDKKHPEYKKLYGFYKKMTDPTGLGVSNFSNPVFGLGTMARDLGKYFINIVAKQPYTQNTTAWGTLFHQDSDHDPSKVISALGVFFPKITDPNFHDINNPGLLQFNDPTKPDMPRGLGGVSIFADDIVHYYSYKVTEKEKFEMTRIYYDIINAAYYYNNKGTDKSMFPPQIFIKDYIFILWIFLPFIIIGSLGALTYLVILFKLYIPVNKQIKKAKNVVETKRKIRLNKKEDAKDNF